MSVNLLQSGVLLKKAGNFHKAEHIFRQILRDEPENKNARLNLGNTLVIRGLFDEGLTELKKILLNDPHNDIVHYNLGYAFFVSQQFKEALLAFTKALTVNPCLINALINRAITFHALGLFENALTDFNQALEQDPTAANTHWNKALTLLTIGRYREGFKAYEWRWQMSTIKQIYPYQFSQPRWQGQPFPNKRLLIFSEQGLGDTIQFIRFLPKVKSLGGTIIFESKPELTNLLDNFKEIDEMSTFSPEKKRGNDFDLQIPLMSLPSLLNTEIRELPPPAHFTVNLDKKTFWHQQLPPDQLNIGLVWAGNPKYSNDKNRSIPLVDFAEIANLRNIHLYSLQKGPPRKQINTVPFPQKITDSSAHLKDFSDTAAIVSELDLIISVDTAVVHLAASLNKPTWVMIPYVPDWRWQKAGKNSLWYPSVKLFRQSKPGNWNTVISEIKRKIESHFLQTVGKSMKNI